MKKPFALAPLALAVACASSPPPAPPSPSATPTATPTPSPTSAASPTPTLRLPTDVRPTHESVELWIDPSKDRFSGAVDIDVTVDSPRRVLWLHGESLHVTRATVTPDGGAPLAAAWEEHDAHGMASLTLPSPVSGAVAVHVEYDARYAAGIDGLHRAEEAGLAYVSSQFEPYSARRAMPCFDEPGFKIPWDETLDVTTDQIPVANQPEAKRETRGAWTRVTFTRTPALPSYLVMFSVGPYDVVSGADAPPSAVRARPLPIRGFAPHGRGKELAYALAHAGEVTARLESYFGIAFPFDKLDLVAEPDQEGAMENAGAITFAEPYLLFDPKSASVHDRIDFADTLVHEIAHQWVGDLVTAAWWDDIWLNEAFATWAAAKIVDEWDPTVKDELDMLEHVEHVMRADSLASARAIRQPITTLHDVDNAFDGLTYQKGAGVVGMFERWLGEATFQRGVHDYLTAHARGNATADDLLAALSAAAGKDVAGPFHTFLDQPGLPFVDAEVTCDATGAKMHVALSRFLPRGSRAEAGQKWQVPVCARVHAKGASSVACALVEGAGGDVPLGATCPDWVMPNADAAGYYRYALAPADRARLARAVSSLGDRERIAYADALAAGVKRGAVPFGDALAVAEPLAKDKLARVAMAPIKYLETADEWLYGDPLDKKVEAYGRKLYGPLFAKLGWDAKDGEDAEVTQRRSDAMAFLALDARDAAVTAEAERRARAYAGLDHGPDGKPHPEAIDPSLASDALATLGRDADVPTWEALRLALGRSVDASFRADLVDALGAASSPALAARARDLALDPVLRASEVARPIDQQLSDPTTRDAAWAWLKAHFTAFAARLSEHEMRVFALDLPKVFCDEAHAADVEATLGKEAPGIEGGPRTLASTLETIRLCAAERAAEAPSARAFFTRR